MSNLEYINQARKLLNEDYKTKHTNEYNGWLIKQQLSWTQPSVIVPFPPFVISSTLAPFKPSVSSPSENEIVAKALELYNRANPSAPQATVTQKVTPELALKVEETAATVEEIIPEPVVEVNETIEEAIPEPVVEDVQIKAPVVSHMDAIYKIYEVMKKDVTVDNDPKFTSIDETLQSVPQPVEELAKVAKSGKILPTMMEKLQSIWTKKGDSDVQ